MVVAYFDGAYHCSNACKFTPTGGSIKVVTKLIHPAPHSSHGRPPTPQPSKDTDPEVKEKDHAEGGTALSITRLSQHNSIGVDGTTSPLNKIVVRVEVHDTGVGIRPKDLIDNKLFRCAFFIVIIKYATYRLFWQSLCPGENSNVIRRVVMTNLSASFVD